METAIIRDAKSLITDFDALRAFYQDLLHTEFASPGRAGEQAARDASGEFVKPVDWGYVLQKLYLHACLKRQHAVAAWLEQVYSGVLDPIQQIAHRHMFAYGRQPLHRRRT